MRRAFLIVAHSYKYICQSIFSLQLFMVYHFLAHNYGTTNWLIVHPIVGKSWIPLNIKFLKLLLFNLRYVREEVMGLWIFLLLWFFKLSVEFSLIPNKQRNPKEIYIYIYIYWLNLIFVWKDEVNLVSWWICNFNYYSWRNVKNLYKLFSTHFLLQVLGKLGELGRLLEEKLVMECLQREPLNQSCLLKMIFHTPYVLRVPSQKAMAPQGEKAF